MSMFSITGAKGFSMKFRNGYRISVQFGPGNYCENHDDSFSGPEMAVKNYLLWKSVDAEIAIIDSDDKFHRPDGWNDDVKGWLNVEQVYEWITYTKNLP